MTHWYGFLGNLPEVAGSVNVPALTVRYEDLCAKPKQVLDAVIQFSDLSYRSDGVEYPPLVPSCDKFLGKNLAYITPRELDALIAATKQWIDEFGYHDVVQQLRDKRIEMSADIALPWTPPTDTKNRLCTLPCSVAAMVPGWDPFDVHNPRSSRYTTKQRDVMMRPPSAQQRDAHARDGGDGHDVPWTRERQSALIQELEARARRSRFPGQTGQTAGVQPRKHTWEEDHE